MNARRTVTVYVVLERKHGWGNRARVVRTAANQPTLAAGQCAVRVKLDVPDEAFEPIMFATEQKVELDNVFRAEAEVG